MDTGEVKKIVIEQGKSAATRQTQLKRLFVGAFVYITVICTVFGLVIWDQNTTITEQGATINELSTLLSRRSPILEYMYCRDNIVDLRGLALSERNSSQTLFVGSLLAADSDGLVNPAEEMEIEKAFADYVKKEEEHTNLFAEPNPCEDPPPANTPNEGE